MSDEQLQTSSTADKNDPELIAGQEVDEEADEDFTTQQDATAGGGVASPSGSGSASDDEDEEEAAGEAVDEDELAALKREAEEEGGDTGELGRGKRRRKVVEQDEGVIGSTSKGTEASDAAWDAFQATSTTAEDPSSSSKQEMIKVIETYRFAGEDLVKERLLPSDHPDAAAYLKKQSSSTAKSLNPSTKPAQETQPLAASSSSIASSIAGPSSLPSSTPTAPPAAAGPRRKKQSKLATLAAAGTQPKKMNTLEKSKMDWVSWKEGGPSPSSSEAQQPQGNGDDPTRGSDGLTEREREEMDQQTRTGAGSGSMAGYLGRRDFLERVRDRTEQ